MEAKRKIAVAHHDFSPVYRKSYKVPGPIKAQITQFRLRTPLVIIESENNASPNGTWTGKECQTLLLSPSRKSVDFGRELNPWLLLRCGTFCISRIWMIHSKIRTSTSILSMNRADSPTMRNRSSLSRDSDYLYLESSASTTPFVLFPRRPLTDSILLRRPLIEQTVPLTVDDVLFDIIAKSIDMKALPFKKTTESFKFYETHFPLILTKVTKEGERCSTPSKRSRTPDSPMTIMIQRQRLLNERLVDLECMMLDMEQATDDCLFITELHDSVFDPTQWKWNKMDVVSLRRRYTIDA